MLQISNVDVYYGNIKALKGVSLEIPNGKIITLLGSNGAGKTTTLNTVCGVVHPSRGQIEFEGERIDRWDPDRIVKLGISQVSEGREIFSLMTVGDNLELGAYIRKDKREVLEDTQRIFEYFPVLRNRRSQKAGTLSGGEQQMLLIGRALMSKPKMLLMDEPSLGLSPLMVEEIFRIIVQIHEEGTTLLLVEQNAQMALGVSEFAYILENGVIRISGDARSLLNNDEVKKSYLGG